VQVRAVGVCAWVPAAGEGGDWELVPHGGRAAAEPQPALPHAPRLHLPLNALLPRLPRAPGALALLLSASARVPVEGAEALALPRRQPLPCAWDAISPGNWHTASPATGTPADSLKRAREQGVQEAAALPAPAFGDSKAAPEAAPALPSDSTEHQGQGDQVMVNAEEAKAEEGEAGDALALVTTCAVQEQEEQEDEERRRAEKEQQQKQQQEQAMCLRALPQHASPRRVNAVLQQVANMSNPLKRLHVAALHTSDLVRSRLVDKEQLPPGMSPRAKGKSQAVPSCACAPRVFPVGHTLSCHSASNLAPLCIPACRWSLGSWRPMRSPCVPCRSRIPSCSLMVRPALLP